MEFENLDIPLLKFADEPEHNAFSIRSSFESLLCLGNTGSGKSSAVAAKIINAYLEHGYGMLLLTAKEEDATTYRSYAKQAGRENDVIEIKPGGEHAFNFMQYESTVRSDLSFARNLQDLLHVVIEAGEERNSGGERDPFWRDSQAMLIKNVINLLLLAYSEVTIPLLYEVAQSTPQQKQTKEPAEEELSAFQKAMSKAKDNVRTKVDDWKSSVGQEYIDGLDDEIYLKQLEEAVPDYRTLKMVKNFFMDGLYNISEKTRGIIILSFTSFLSHLMDDPIYTLFCNKPSTCTPEDCIEQGKIIIINLPVSLYGKIGQYVQIMSKYVFQKAWQRRRVSENGRPLAIIADEAQLFLHPQDSMLLATARSSRISTFYLSQNLPALHANVGGNGFKSEAKVDALLSLLSTKIFLCNNCVKTNRWASDIIGKAYTEDISTGSSYGDDKVSINDGSRFSLEDIIRPEAFAKLLTGSQLNNYKVEAYIHMQGKKFNHGFSHKKIRFTQQVKEKPDHTGQAG